MSAPSADFANVVLRTRAGEEIKAGSLWAQRPVVMVLLRRPGCVLCRDNASELWATVKEEADRLGVHLVCVVHEWINREIEAFSPTYWPGELYHDVNKDLYKVLGGGKLLRASVLSMLNPFSAVWARIRKAQAKIKDHNLVGEGFILGGVLVVSSAAGKAKDRVLYMHVEREIGLPPSLPDVLDAARRAAADAPPL